MRIFILLCMVEVLPISYDLNKLTIDQKIGQLFAISIPLPSSQAMVKKLCNFINTHHIGSVLLDRKGTIKQQIRIVNSIIKECHIQPLLLEDLEYGLSMRLYDSVKFPLSLTCGAIQDDNLIYQMAQEIGRQCKLLGVDINLAPVLDINYNASNSLAERSYGKSEENVMRKGKMYITGMLSQGVYPCAKHFPGHGDSNIDPHLGFPTVDHTKRRLTIELFPFKHIANITPCIMPGHICVTAYDNRPKYCATISKPIIKDLLKKQLNFNGLIISDALRMKALAQSFDNETIVRESFNAGVDILLCPPSIINGIQTIKKGLADGTISESEINEHVQKILTIKKTLGTFDKKEIDIEDCIKKIKLPTTYQIKKNLYEQAITLIKNQNNQLPLTDLENVAYIQIGGTFDSPFYQQLQTHNTELINNLLPASPAGYDINELIYQLESINTVIVSLMCMNTVENQQFGISEVTRELIKQIKKLKKVILVIFGTPYSLQYFEDIPTIIMAYEDDPDAQIAAAQIVTGKLTARGKLPVSVSEKFPEGLGL